MNRKLKLFGLSLLLLALAVPAAAANFAVLDVNRVVSECKAGVRVQADIKQRFDRVNGEIAKVGEELQAMRQDYQKQVSMMNDAAKSKRQQEMEQKFGQFNQMRMQARQEITEAEHTALAPILENLKVILNDMGKRNKYTAILEVRNLPYYDPSLDITNEVIKAYDRAHP